SATISITSNDGNDNPFSIAVIGAGVTNTSIVDASVPNDLAIGTSPNSPGAEAAAKAIDNDVSSKYLNLDKLNTGLTITPSGQGPVRALTLISANDAPERDPSSFVLEGSTN